MTRVNDSFCKLKSVVLTTKSVGIGQLTRITESPIPDSRAALSKYFNGITLLNMFQCWRRRRQCCCWPPFRRPPPSPPTRRRRCATRHTSPPTPETPSSSTAAFRLINALIYYFSTSIYSNNSKIKL